MTTSYKYCILELLDGSFLRFSDYGSCVDTQNASNVFQGRIAYPGMESSALEIPRGLEHANLTLTIAFDDEIYPQVSKLLRDVPILEKVKVRVGFAVDNVRTNVFYGYVANLTFTDLGMTLELESILNILGKSKIFKTGTSCRNNFPACGVDMNINGRTKNRIITLISPDRLNFQIDNTVPDSTLNLGAAHFAIGNENVLIDILGNTSNTVYTFECLPLDVEVGNSVSLAIGCNRSWARCKELGNVSSFGGSPPSANFLINNRMMLSGTKDLTH
jgi:hypothetical protein